MSSLSPPALSWSTGGKHPGRSSLSRLWPRFHQIPTSQSLSSSPNTPLLTISQQRNGLRAGQMSWKAGGEWERRWRRPRTRDGLRPAPSATPTFWNLPGTDLQGSGTISFSSSFLPLLQARSPSGQWGAGILRREQRPEQEGLLHTSALGHVRATSSTNSGPQFPLPPAVRQKRARPPPFPPPYQALLLFLLC